MIFQQLWKWTGHHFFSLQHILRCTSSKSWLSWSKLWWMSSFWCKPKMLTSQHALSPWRTCWFLTCWPHWRSCGSFFKRFKIKDRLWRQQWKSEIPIFHSAMKPCPFTASLEPNFRVKTLLVLTISAGRSEPQYLPKSGAVSP